MRYDAVLFDLDGTLTASAPGICGSVQHTMTQMGVAPLHSKELQRFVGPPLHESFQQIAGLTQEEAEKAVILYREHYAENGLLDAHVFTGIPNLLRRLKEEGVYIAVATAKPKPSAMRVLKHFGLARFFDKIVGAGWERRESSKESLLREALPPRYHRAVMVGDRCYDMEAAKKIGIDAMGVAWGYGSQEELENTGADFVAQNVREAMKMLLGDAAYSPKGFFISTEGLDGSGKTTQMNAMASYIRARGYEVLETREPGGTPVSEAVRKLVLDPNQTICAQTEALLYAAARAQHVQDVILPAINRGKVVLCDRYVDSSIAYQGAGRELGMEKVMAINMFATGGAMPELTLLFVVDAQTALLRRSSATKLDRLERAGELFFKRVYDAYAEIAKDTSRVCCIDACRDIKSVTADAYLAVERLLASR